MVCRRSCLVGVGGFVVVVVIAEQDPEGGLRSPRKTRGSAAGAVWSQTAGLAERPAVTQSGTEGSGGRRQAAVAVEQGGALRWCAWIRLAVPPACGTLDAVSWTPGLPVCWLYYGVCRCPMGNRAPMGIRGNAGRMAADKHPESMFRERAVAKGDLHGKVGKAGQVTRFHGGSPKRLLQATGRGKGVLMGHVIGYAAASVLGK